jgi:DNA polymerase III delta prime subunit
MSMPEQYRRSFAEYIDKAELPHLLFYGPAGSGKTTMAFILTDTIKCTRLVLNASSEDRGVSTMRGKVKTFAGSGTIDKRLKVVFMDEIDGTTQEAQRALKNTIENYASQCRFIFTCNEIDRVDSAIISRCIKFEFTAFPKDQLLQHLENILEAEKVSYETEGVNKIIEQFYPDIRSIVNNLQFCSSGGKLDPEAISRVSVDPNIVLDHILDGEVGKLRTVLSGVTNFDFLYKFLYGVLLGADDLDVEEKTEVVHLLSEHLFRDASIANREINFVDFSIELMGILKPRKISFTA